MTRFLLLFALLTASACASDEAQPVLAEEIQFLTACSSDAECGDLACLCGVCTTPCTSSCEVGACATPEGPAFMSYCASSAPSVGLCLEACAMDADCTGGTCVDGLCAAAEVTSPACATDADCASGMCVDGGCRATEADPADRCSTHADCASGLCQDGTCTTREPEPSDRCSTDADCASGTCLDGLCLAQ